MVHCLLGVFIFGLSFFSGTEWLEKGKGVGPIFTPPAMRDIVFTISNDIDFTGIIVFTFVQIVGKASRGSIHCPI